MFPLAIHQQTASQSLIHYYPLLSYHYHKHARLPRWIIIFCSPSSHLSPTSIGRTGSLSSTAFADDRNEAQQLPSSPEHAHNQKTTRKRLPRWCVSRNPIPLFQALSIIGRSAELPGELFRLRRLLESFFSLSLTSVTVPCWHERASPSLCRYIRSSRLLEVTRSIPERHYYQSHSKRSFQDFFSTAI